MTRLRLKDLRDTNALAEQGYCANDPRIGPLATRAQSRLINAKEDGDEGWWGTWAEMAFTVSHDAPYLTTPREVARLEMVTVCDRAVPINNQFFEYLEFGNGRLPKACGMRHRGHRLIEAYQRNVVPLFVDLGDTPQNIQIFTSDPADVAAGKRVLLQGKDPSGVAVYTLDQSSGFQVQGEYNPLASPFALSPTVWSDITGIQKDITRGYVQIFKVDPTTQESTLILTMEPSEQTAGYRRYYFHNLPRCIGSNASPAPPVDNSIAFGNPDQGIVFGNPDAGIAFGQPQPGIQPIPTPAGLRVTALVKLDPVPLVADSDYFILQGDGALEAIIEECQAIRYSTMDTTEAKQMSRERHNLAIQLLNGTLTHYMGIDKPAVSFKPFGSARLERVHIGMI